MEARKLLFALIREEIYGVPCTLEINPALLPKVYALAKAHDLAHILASPLERRGLLGQDDLSKSFRKQQTLALYRYELSRHELASICRVLTEAGIPHMLLKGSVIRDLYPRPYLRTSCDIDLLVKEADLREASAVLTQRLGYTAKNKPAFHDLSLYSRSGVHLELHFHLKEHCQPMDDVLETVWEHAVEREGTTYVQDTEFLMFHSLAHMAYHFYRGGCGIKPLVDLRLLKEKLQYDEGVFLALCREAGLKVFYENALLLCEVWFGDGAHTPLTAGMEQYLLRGGVYGSTENHVALNRQRAGGKLRYALSRIWMPKEQLRMRYPEMKKSVLLIPWYQVRRWVETVFGGRLKHAAGEMRANSRISESSSAATDGMMRELGL